MVSEHVARRYVQAVFDVAAARQVAEPLGHALAGLEQLYREHGELREVLLNPRLPASVKRALLLRLVGEDAPELLARFLSLLLAKRRLEVLAHAGRLFRLMQEEAAGIRRAVVTTPLPLSEAQQARLVDVLSRALQGQVRLEVRVDPEVLAGIQVRVGDRLMDGTLRRRLEGLRQRLWGGPGAACTLGRF